MLEQIYNEDHKKVEETKLWQALESAKRVIESLISILPTVVISLGWTGQEIASNFKKSVLRVGIDTNDRLYYRALDADDTGQHKFAPGDFYQVTGNLEDIFTRMVYDERFYQDLRQRIGDPSPHLDQLGSVGDEGEGTEQKPANSTTLLEHYYKQHGEHLSSWLTAPFETLRNVGQVADENGHGETDALQAVNGWIIKSDYGGFGAGAGLPLACRLFHDLSEVSRLSFRLNMITFAPGVVKGQPKQDVLKAIFVERIRDYDAHIKKNLPEIKIGGKGVSRRRFPIHQLFILDSQDELGGGYTAQQVYDRAACGLRLMTAGVIAQKRRSDSQNDLGDLQKYPYYLNTFNCVEWVVRPQELQQKFAWMIAPQVIKTELQRTVTNQEAQQILQDKRVREDEALDKLVKGRVKAFLTKNKLSLAALNQWFSVQDISLKPIVGLRGAALRKELRDLFVREFPQRKLALEEQKAKKLKGFLDGLGQELEELHNQFGTKFSRLFLAELTRQLQKMRSRLDRSMGETRTQIADYEQKLAPNPRKLVRLLTSSRDKLLPKQADLRLVKLMSLIFKKKLILLKQTVLDDFEAACLTKVSTQDGGLANAEAQSDNAISGLKQDEEDYQQTRKIERPSCEKSVLTETEENQMFVLSQPRALNQLVQGISYRWVAEQQTIALQLQFTNEPEPRELALATLTEAQLRQTLGEYCQQPFTFLAEELSVEQILEKQGRHKDHVLQALMQQTAPLLALNLSAQEDETNDMVREIYIASEFGEEGFWSGVMKPPGCNILKSGDPHRISVLTTLYKISPRAIKGYSEWVKSWQKMRAKGYPMQIFSDQDLDLEDKTEPEKET